MLCTERWMCCEEFENLLDLLDQLLSESGGLGLVEEDRLKKFEARRSEKVNVHYCSIRSRASFITASAGSVSSFPLRC